MSDRTFDTVSLNTSSEDISLTDTEKYKLLGHIIELKNLRLKVHMDEISKNILVEKNKNILAKLKQQESDIFERLSGDKGILNFCKKYEGRENFNVEQIQDSTVKDTINRLDLDNTVPDYVGMF